MFILISKIAYNYFPGIAKLLFIAVPAYILLDNLRIVQTILPPYG